ncbi:serine protease [[Clostridium] sordellii]|uniref:S8 family serine peptidase n=1 Tax=Paraclostridium sordellii TaxID=1505 RepID=UPI0005DF5A6A|nr:S8 family serine peptidase [Paeniclostridium sordellii]CEN23292.1 serine protease [[Clostridium] sordellii] [Paeniclostridium sordellii]
MRRKIKVAILDTGIDLNHEYLKNNIIEGFGFTCTDDDYIKINTNYEDDNGHGTACASIVKNEFNNVEFIVIKVLDKYGRTNIQILEEALKILVEKDIDIINLSLSVMKSEMVKDLYNICEDLTNKGKIIVCSLANGFNESYPAIFDNVIGVKGFTLEDEDFFWFNRDKKIQCVIDNNPYFQCHLNNTYNLFGKSNSQAAAKFTGKIARIMSESNNINFNNIYDTLEKLAQRTVWEEQDLDTSKRYPNFKQDLYKRDNPILIKTAQSVTKVLQIEEEISLYNYSLFNKHLGLTYDKCFELLKDLENIFKFKFKYLEISRDDFLSIYTLTELVEKNLKNSKL